VNYSLKDAKCLVVKIGSALLVDNKTGLLHREWLVSLIQDVMECWQRGQRVVLVSSGAIALGRRHLGLKTSVLQLEEKQAAAAVGQIKLAHAYQEILEAEGITVAQILLTLDDSENRKRYLNAKNTLETLLNLRAIPVINENDSVATAEIRYGDNDRLAARVAQMVSADTLVLLSDVDGLYTANPVLDPKASLIPEVTQLTPEIMQMAGSSVSRFGSGGMITKLSAAKIALASGCRMVIAAGKHLHPLKRIDEVKEKTWFIPTLTPTKARKSWLAQHLQPKGSITIDAGAAHALKEGKSLLAAGILTMEGDFHKGDAVCILNAEQEELARGLINYPAHEGRKLIGQRSSEFEKILGYCGSEEMIHRDDLVLIQANHNERD
jgi:glutamate 5-kinase